MTDVIRVWLDLEGTVIALWQNPEICDDIAQIRSYLLDLGVSEVSIFSFACWHDRDLIHFNRVMREPIEQALGMRIAYVPTVNDIMREIFWKTGALMSVEEFTNQWSKARAFHEFVMMTQADWTSHYLIDDDVPNATTHDHDRCMVIKTINVTALGECR